MQEIKSLRKKREKHYLNEDGTFTVYAYNNDIHYFKDGKYEEIDNTILEKDNKIENKANDFKAEFAKSNTDNFLIKITKDNNEIKLDIPHKNINKKLENNSIIYNNILEDIDIKYDIIGSKVKDYIILNNKNNLTNLKYLINTNLELKLNNNGNIEVLKEKESIFNISKPTLTDKHNENHLIKYNLEKNDTNYVLSFDIEDEVLNNIDLYPLVIDPSIETKDDNSLFDTFIFPNDANVDRNNCEMLKIGVDENNIVYRTLIKFNLPDIGTAYDVINAKVFLTSYPEKFKIFIEDGDDNDENNLIVGYLNKAINIHAINTTWSEETANWNNMNDKYDGKIENYFMGVRPYIRKGKPVLTYSNFDITNLVKRWYAGKPNNGIMLKWNDEAQEENKPEDYFYSKNNTAAEFSNIENPKPFLVVTYQNKNGLENYMSYQSIEFDNGISYINHLTGNVTNIFSISKNLGPKFPAELSLIYNTNDVLLKKNYGCGIGYRFNYIETLKEVNYDYVCLEYEDYDGTIHYFKNIEDEIIDEDGLGLTAKKSDNVYTITDKTGNRMEFTLKNQNTYYLTKIIDTTNNCISIVYSTDNKIIRIIDGDNEEINITYLEDKIIATSNYLTTTINLTNNKVISIVNKFGTTSFVYNTNNIISKITDTNGLSKKYEYYNSIPYRLYKLSELGLNEQIGNYFTYVYEFNVTRITDSKGRVNTYIFNDEGNTIGLNCLDKDGNLNKGYGVLKEYFSADNNKPELKNKLRLETSAIKYINNYFEDGSFENGTYPISMLTDEFAHSGKYSLKVNRLHTFYLPKNLEYDEYTFSAYIRTNKKATIQVYYDVAPDVEIKWLKKYEILPSEDFVRISVPLNVNSEYESQFYRLELLSSDFDGIIYVDDVQIENGGFANYYNLIDNSNFNKDTKNWSYTAVNKNGDDITDDSKVITMPSGNTAFCLQAELDTSKSLSQNLNISGKANDTYSLSFWYKNEGIKADDITDANMAILTFNYPYNEEGHCNIPCILKNNTSDWQFYQTIFIAEYDYDGASLSFISQNNVNNFYFTNISLTKDIESNTYSYDDAGNLISSTNKTNGANEFKYDKNNQLIGMFSPKGSSFTFEYDNNNKTQVLQGKSKKGISNKIEYDEFNNPIKTKIQNLDTTDIDNKLFYIRLKGTNKYLIPNYVNYRIECIKPLCSNECFEIEKNNDNNNYYLKSSVIPMYINEIGYLSKEKNTIFEIINNDNGSVSFKIVDTDKALIVKDNRLGIEVYNKEENKEQFYFEPYESQEYIETTAKYTSDGKFIKSTTDALGQTTLYDIDKSTGLTNSITNPKGEVTNYSYNDKEQITKVKKNNKETNYSYNDKDLLEKITCENKEYSFTYDEFLNAKEVKINNNTLVTNEYEENNGNLKSSEYGNYTNVSYTYDELDRLKTLNKNDRVYNHYYDSLNRLAKITEGRDIYNYYYDLASRLSKYEILKHEDDFDYSEKTYKKKFSIDYDYDLNNNITKKKYESEGLKKEISYSYDEDDTIIKVTLENDEINFNYDELGRISNKNINNNLPVEYEYYKNGNKSSLILKSMKIDNDIYEYKFDELYNLIDIYKNNELINHYLYDEYNELIEDDNYLLNKKYKFSYDNSGNILKKEEYDLINNVLVKEDTYEYTNTLWKDQLTKFNNEEILYDEIGNPVKIGETNLTWYARELQSYKNSTLDIRYFYNKDGIRTSKTINGVTTNYLLENSNIIFEETNGNVIYYMRTDENDLLGFIYNNNKYYYRKNYQNDITGIYNSNYDLICEYEYDSYGRIISIKDSNGNQVNEEHIGNINPYRYRSYYYDKETKLYYLNSRYYNPLWGRFINADGIISGNKDILSHNLYIYCSNNPIIVHDNGKFIVGLIAAVVILVSATKVVSTAIGKIKNMPISSSMLNSAIDNRNIDKNTKKELENKVKNSLEMKKEIEKCISSNKNNNTFTCTGAVNGNDGFVSDMDLHGAVGHSFYTINGMKKEEKRIDLEITISDTYDFTIWQSPFGGFFNAANDFGFIYQKLGLLTPYEWDLTYKDVYYEK